MVEFKIYSEYEKDNIGYSLISFMSAYTKEQAEKHWRENLKDYPPLNKYLVSVSVSKC